VEPLEGITVNMDETKPNENEIGGENSEVDIPTYSETVPTRFLGAKQTTIVDDM